MVKWRIRAKMEEIDVGRRYAGHPTIFSILLNHGGEFTEFPDRKYIKGKQNFVDLIDIDTFSVHKIEEILEDLGYLDEGIPLYFHFKRPLGDLDFGLFALASFEDVRRLRTYVATHKLIEVYIEHGKSQVHTNIEPGSSSKMFLGWKNTNIEVGSSSTPVELDKEVEESNRDRDVEGNGENVKEGNGENVEEGEWGDVDEGSRSDEASDDEDSDFFVDEDNVLDDVHVDMNDFNMNVDNDVEWIGVKDNARIEEVLQEVDDEVLDNDILLSGSSSDEGPVHERKKTISSIRRAHENDDAFVSEPFYVFQTFTSAKAFKDQVNVHAIETRRELYFEKNDKNRVRVLCRGTIPNLGAFDNGEPNQQAVNNEEDNKCPWVLYASKWKRDVNWTVKSYQKEHRCLQVRDVRACNYKFLAKEIANEVACNPSIPVTALMDSLQRKFQVNLSFMKVFRAKHAALNLIRGDYAGQYKLLRDYAMELQTRNPDTTVKVEVESEGNADSETRTFKRIYICLGPLKKGFAAGKRDLLGLDGAFLKGPFPGQVLTAVGLDGNNGIYTLAYAVVEAENTNSWTWFLTCLGDDLGLNIMSNFTFITDRQKGVILAIEKLFPCAEHRYCLRHLHQSMKLKWKGDEFKDALWKCATCYTVQDFQRAMEELKKLNNGAYEWLKKIPPSYWSRSHFSGRAHSEAFLNNMCESLNSKTEPGRDKPIITCLEFIMEYLMKKIVNVQQNIDKATGPLTPTATIWLERLKTKALEFRAIFCGNQKYQVTGNVMDQFVVDMGQQTCSCRKWEVTGMPCKHAIAAIWEMRKNNEHARIPESWVHRTYWLQTWKEMYSFKIDPINGRNMWEKSPCPTTLLPPKYKVPIGRPKKKRRKSAVEVADLVKGHTASRAHKSVTCSKCDKSGHNARTCKGQIDGAGQSSSNVGVGGRAKKNSNQSSSNVGVSNQSSSNLGVGGRAKKNSNQSSRNAGVGGRAKKKGA